jgi:hypothetical protein
MEDQINDILKRRGALHVINGHRMYSEESVKSALKEALQQVNSVDLADVVLSEERTELVCNSPVNKCPSYMQDKNGEKGCKGCEYYH